jgi:hypothetical protein
MIVYKYSNCCSPFLQYLTRKTPALFTGTSAIIGKRMGKQEFEKGKSRFQERRNNPQVG